MKSPLHDGMIDDLLGPAVPVKFSSLPVRSCRHAGPHGMPESAANVAVGILIPRPHAIDPVVEVRLSVVALPHGRKLASVTFDAPKLSGALLARPVEDAAEKN